MTLDWQQVQEFGPELSVALDILLALAAASHVILNKSDTRAATAWVALIWLLPFLGSILYFFLGINRIQRRAKVLKSGATDYSVPLDEAPRSPADLDRELGSDRARLIELARVVTKVTERPLLVGNDLDLLVDGDEAYPAMIAAIGEAKESISLMSYIFEAEGVGAELVDALADACARGVEVRVLVDDVGVRYARPRIHRVLKQRGVPVANFLPALLPGSITHFNLRNHCKIVVVDGRVGFTGGMNIRQDSVLSSEPGYPTKDVHFRVHGPVVAQLQEAFARDWVFTTGERLAGRRWFPELAPAGETLARGINDGPDRDIDKLHWVFLAAVGAARRSIRIMTPYFLPDSILMKSLHLAAQRGVEVDIIVPEVGNLPVVRWAMWGNYRRVLYQGIRLWLTPPPFDHSKLFVVDGYWSSIGSANWDPRSLRLNFEFNLECYDEGLGQNLEDHVRNRLIDARLLTIQELDGRSLFRRLRDGTARLWTPYL
ncbi:MAG: cardiolipin synthase [Myxococcales bacterium]|nr:cardiolipin synthase [Myxococcales bacterium]